MVSLKYKQSLKLIYLTEQRICCSKPISQGYMGVEVKVLRLVHNFPNAHRPCHDRVGAALAETAGL